MNFPAANLTSFHSEVLQKTALGQLCGQSQLFRERYQILRLLGRGGFGVTFLAKDMTLPGNPLCVIKQLCPKFSDPTAIKVARERFRKEAKALSLLGSHSQIPLLLDYFVMGEEFYLVQEYIKGVTLARLVRRHGHLSEATVTRFLKDMLSLLCYIHSRGVIHRDIKPQNVILAQEDRRLVLIDFGAVKHQIARLDSSAREHSTEFIGTVGFAPPEQFSLRPVYASDIYALGATCLYLLTGKAPLDFSRNLRSNQIYWRDRVQVSSTLGDILDKMLQVSLIDRYRCATAIIKALEEEQDETNLHHCLSFQPNIHEFAHSKHHQSHDEGYQSPAVRSAIAIREWKARSSEKHLRRQSRQAKQMLSNSW